MSNLSQTTPTNVKVGDTIRYEVVSPNDTVLYSGTVVAICDYLSARSYADVAALHQEMMAGNPDLIDCDLLQYIVVECYDGVRRPVGFDPDGSNSWFKDNKVDIITVGNNCNIRLYNVSASEVNVALRILRENGYTCKVVAE